MDKERTIHIHEEEEKALRFVDETGTSHIFALLTSVRPIYLNATSLSLSEVFDSPRSDEPVSEQQLIPRRFVRGFGILCDQTVSIIGDPENTTKRIALWIRVRTADERGEARRQSKEERGSNDRSVEIPSHCDAVLGFTAAWGMGNKDEWWLELDVPEKALESLADAILNKRIRSLYIAVGLRNIYTDAGPFGKPVNLFLRPSIDGGNVRKPEAAHGNLKSWSLRFSGTDELSDPFERESVPTPEMSFPEEPRGLSDTEKMLAALEKLTAGVGSLRTTIVRLAWVLAAVLIVSALIR